MVKRIGKFGNLVKHYEKARRPYPPEVFYFLKSLLKIKNPFILDLGCGTGISTRQLAKIATVVGCDLDPIMLKAARKHKRSGVKKYVLGRAEKIPFKDQTFDGVTAFSAFHWFYNKKSIKEIKRVLKLNGIFFTANHSGSKNWGEGYRQAIMKSINGPVAGFKTKHYKPEKIMRLNGLKNIRIKLWNKPEFYNLAEALNYVQSVSIWNTVPIKLRSKAVNDLRLYFKNIETRGGKILRNVKVKAVAGRKVS